MQETIDKLTLKIKDFEATHSPTSHNDPIDNEITEEITHIEIEHLPSIDNKTVLFVGGRLNKNDLTNIFPQTNVLHVSSEDISLLKNSPKVDMVVFFHLY